MLFNDKARFGGSTPGRGGTSERKGLRALTFPHVAGLPLLPQNLLRLEGSLSPMPHCAVLLLPVFWRHPFPPIPSPAASLHLYLPGIPSSPCQFRQRLQTLPPIPEVQLPPPPGKKRTLSFVTPQVCAKRGEASSSC